MSLPGAELDKILCCNQPCKKDLPFCKHFCKAICHKGPCPNPELCGESVTVRCKCKTRAEVWPCSKAQVARKALGVKDKGYLTLLECDEACRAKKEAEEAAKMVAVETEASSRKTTRQHQQKQQPRKASKKETPEKAQGASRVAKVSVAVAAFVCVMAFIVYVVTTSY